MASDLSAVSQEHKTGNNSATSAQTEDISSSSPAAITHSEANESLDHASSTSKTSTSAENRLRPAAGIVFSNHSAQAGTDKIGQTSLTGSFGIPNLTVTTTQLDTRTDSMDVWRRT